jgi:hypothetical protein
MALSVVSTASIVMSISVIVIKYRQEHRDWNHERPGQGYFLDSRFDVAAPLAEPVRESAPTTS